MKFAILVLTLVTLSSASPLSLLDAIKQQETGGFKGKQWALLIAGSNTYDNYRHQADVCHAFQVLKNHGIPEEQIVVMMYDDIANSDENPFPGTIINKPGGKDVYHGVPKDYTGDDVTPDNAIKILNGDSGLKAAGKKVIESTEDDHVFVYFADHGATDLVAFPNDELSAEDLNAALKKLAKAKKFNKLVLYVEACESGSMFEGLLPKNLNIFATTAANSDESSYACYWDDDRETYLGDLYSVNWIEDSDGRKSLNKETLQAQFKIVKNETDQSHVMEYGDQKISKLPLSQFQGPKKAKAFDSVRVPKDDAVVSWNVPLIRAQKKLAAAKTPDARGAAQKRLKTIVAGREFVINSVHKLAKAIEKRHQVANLVHTKLRVNNHACVTKVYKAFDTHCFDLSRHTFAMRHLYVLANTCEQLTADDQVEQLIKTVTEQCRRGKVGNHSFERIV